MHPKIPIIFGGHSFINASGNEPRPDDEAMEEIVSACLDNGICRFDATYQPERIRCGQVLQRLGRRHEAELIVWNFFGQFGLDDEISAKREPYRAEHLSLLQEQCQSDHIDSVVVHLVRDEVANRTQLDVVSAWKETGHVGKIGLWSPPADPEERFGDYPIDFMTDTWRYTTQDPDMPLVFNAAKKMGWTTHATSPFRRGWDLDKFIQNADQPTKESEQELRARLADYLIRYSFSLPCVDQVIIGMRKAAHVQANIQSWRKGPLTTAELKVLSTIRG